MMKAVVNQLKYMMRVCSLRVGCLMMSRKLPWLAEAFGFVRMICKVGRESVSISRRDEERAKPAPAPEACHSSCWHQTESAWRHPFVLWGVRVRDGLNILPSAYSEDSLIQ